MTTNTTINAAQNPALANQLASNAIALAEQEAAVAKPKAKVTLPPDPVVELLGGVEDPLSGTITTAEVRELTGVDEEIISKITDTGKSLLTILERATVRIGSEPATPELLDVMYAGDRELLLLKIRNVTFGAEVKMGPGSCPECGQEQIFKLDLENDVPMKKLEGGREFEVSCKVGKVLVTLPTGHTQKAIVTSSNKTTAELDTLLLRNCIKSINGNTDITFDMVRGLSLKDRKEILSEITNRNPGPQLSDIKGKCQSCDSEVSLPLTLADLFR